jgi:DNA-binding CsgD family transcriptional regulator
VSTLRVPPEEVRRLAGLVLDALDPVTDQLVAAIVAEDPSYGLGRTSGADLRESCHDNLARILQSLTGDQQPGDVYDAPHATGRRRAEQGMPLESVLHAYRLGHRIIWDSLVEQARNADTVEALVVAASHVWELVDSYSSEVARAYRDTESHLLRRDDQRRDALVDALLEGRGRDRVLAAEAANALDLPEHGAFVVAVLSGNGWATATAAALSVRGVRSVWRDRADREVGLIAVPRGGWEDVAGVLEKVTGLRGGLSPQVEGLSEVDGAYRLAETALRALPTSQSGVAALDERLPGSLLVTAPDLSKRLVDRALSGLRALDPEERDLLLLTLRTWLDTGGSAAQTAARLYCHRNTVLNRLRRIEALTGRSLERVDHLVEWSLALLARDLLPLEPPA